MLSDREAPLYEIKADLFKGLAHPLRIRILEILSASPQGRCTVSELLDATGLEASHLSQHLATLRRHRVVTSLRVANSVQYTLACPEVAKLLATARAFLRRTLADAGARLQAAEQLPSVGGVRAKTRVTSRTGVSSRGAAQ